MRIDIRLTKSSIISFRKIIFLEIENAFIHNLHFVLKGYETRMRINKLSIVEEKILKRSSTTFPINFFIGLYYPLRFSIDMPNLI